MSKDFYLPFSCPLFFLLKLQEKKKKRQQFIYFINIFSSQEN